MSLEICGLSNNKHFQKEQMGRAGADGQMPTSLVLSDLEL